eukprot:CAMPEP_0179100486 /NCGR_PEP_ID=MMETSP0796-20121207/46411_1 /TAXON_ID=73915 /ORGANISM="Pyrodinium bahamense, Strain pbaha01" /LENGTH=93 /DNA_ID=CAMNT_0020798311 /DNA_START=296 /DNA_END=577 /DNA_ORIENTATION=+
MPAARPVPPHRGRAAADDDAAPEGDVQHPIRAPAGVAHGEAAPHLALREAPVPVRVIGDLRDSPHKGLVFRRHLRVSYDHLHGGPGLARLDCL